MGKKPKDRGKVVRIHNFENLLVAQELYERKMGPGLSQSQVIEAGLFALREKLSYELIPAPRAGDIIQEKVVNIVGAIITAWLQRESPEHDGEKIEIGFLSNGQISLQVGEQEPIYCPFPTINQAQKEERETL